MNTDIKAVIFDLDGTLTDTEKYYKVAWPAALEHYGYKADPDMILGLRSLGRPFAPRKFREWFGDDFDYDKVREYRKKLVSEMIKENGIPLKPGAKEILIWLRENGITTALATANDLKRTTGYLKLIGLDGLLDRIICADMVKQGKPAPDIYSYACETLGLHPRQTLAVEDSPNGIESALGAGCNVVMVPDLTEPDDDMLSRLYARVDTLSEIKGIILKTVEKEK
ncbi:MAG: HAD family phosphatase [Clostridiales bacterium]|nr:HAD family phosphatase [Clostridiales bacterium]